MSAEGEEGRQIREFISGKTAKQEPTGLKVGVLREQEYIYSSVCASPVAEKIIFPELNVDEVSGEKACDMKTTEKVISVHVATVQTQKDQFSWMM